jgi:hypothetical protein
MGKLCIEINDKQTYTSRTKRVYVNALTITNMAKA